MEEGVKRYHPGLAWTRVESEGKERVLEGSIMVKPWKGQWDSKGQLDLEGKVEVDRRQVSTKARSWKLGHLSIYRLSLSGEQQRQPG